MDPPPPPSATTTTTTTSKLRLMCSYGGHIIPRPHTKSLYYAGGDTRIITITIPITTTPSNNLTLSSLTTHIANTLHINYTFTLKYQLPNHDLDSLICLSTDEDLLIMLDEHQHHHNHRLSSSSRIRLFVFPTSKLVSSLPELSQSSELTHPKTESWFVDALKSAKIMQFEGCSNGGGGGVCGAESVVLETSSSFGSTSSSVSLSNLPVKGQVEDSSGAGFVDNKVKLCAAGESVASENSAATAVSNPQTGTGQDPVGPVAAMEDIVFSSPFESESKMPYPSTGIDVHKTVQVSGFPGSLYFDQLQQLQFIHTGVPHYMPQNPTGTVPISSYYLVNSPLPQQQLYYRTNQSHPIYFVPVGQPYTLPMQSGLCNTATAAYNCTPVHPNTSLDHVEVAFKVAAASPVPELASQVYLTVPMASSFVNVPHNENHQQAGGLPQMTLQAQSIGVTSMEAANYGNELDDDPARVQIYKSQPPPPTLPSQCHDMTKATTVLLPEALAQLRTEDIKQQLRNSQPQ